MIREDLYCHYSGLLSPWAYAEDEQPTHHTVLSFVRPIGRSKSRQTNLVFKRINRKKRVFNSVVKKSFFRTKP